MSFSLELTPAQHDLVARVHRFAEEEIRPMAAHYDHEEGFPWPVLERAAEEGLYNALFYRDLITDPTAQELRPRQQAPLPGRHGAAAHR